MSNMDLIRKQDAIDAVKNWIKSEEFRWSNATYYMEKRIPKFNPYIDCLCFNCGAVLRKGEDK